MGLNSFLKLIRIPNDIMIGIGVIIAEIIANQGPPTAYNIVFGFLTGFLISASVMVINDIADIDIDRINNPSRPLVRGEISIKNAYYLAFFFMIIGCITSLFTGVYTLLLAITFWIIGYLYNFYFKRKGLFGNALVSLSVAVPFIYGSIVIGGLSINNIILSIEAFLTNMYREIIKGIIDIEGDKIFGVQTLAVKYGVRKAYIISIFFLACAIVISIFPYIWTTVINLEIYLSMIILTDVILFLSVITPYIIKDRKGYLYSKRIVLLGMLLGMITFLLSNVS